MGERHIAWCVVIQRPLADLADRAIIHPDLPYLHIVHPLPPVSRLPYPPSEDDLVNLADELAPALMRSLDLAFDALRRSGGDRSQGWNLLLTTLVHSALPLWLWARTTS